VLLLGVSHTSNTTIHLAEQYLGRSRFYRYAKSADGLWAELPNIPGASHEFDAIEADPAGLLCTNDPTCRCAAALQQRMAAQSE
jgi:aminoglycoside 3-N-acetyltransferase